MRELHELIERVAALTEPDRDVDAEIYEAIGFEVKRRPEIVPGSWRRMTRSFAYFHEGRWRAMDRLTGSTDAAIALTERVLPGWLWEVTTTGFKPGASVVRQPANFGAYAATPAVALVLATLKALAAREGAHE